MSSRRQDEIRAALEAIRAANGGRLTKQAVVAAARSKRHTLHREFDWNDKSAAYTARLDRAQELISRYVTITVVSRSMEIKSPFYVRDPATKTNEGGYIPLGSKDIDRTGATNIVLGELARCKSAIERARGVAAVLDANHPGLSEMLQRMLTEIVTMEEYLAAAA